MIGVGTAGPLPGSATAGSGWTTAELPHLDPEAERPYWIALSLVPGVGPVGFGRLLRRFGSGRAAWAAGVAILDELPRVPPEAERTLSRLQATGVAARAGRIMEAVQRVGGRAVTALDRDYPAALAGLDPRPPVLYVIGDQAALEAPSVAVVGTRRATGYGRASATEIADELARAGATVVSGLAVGIDGEAHAAALAAGGRTVAVLPSPIDRVYPPRHRDLAARIVASGGCLISELAPGHAVGKPDFARRNRIIAGLSMAVVVVEAPDQSGALLTAAAALEISRELYAVPGPIHSIASRGCNRLLADQSATIVTSAAGLLQRIGVRRAEGPLSVANLSDAEGLVLATLLKRPASIEELMTRTLHGTAPVAAALTLLEARGLVTAYGGATFHPTLAARRIGRVPGHVP